ncbi:14362_t:CDS:2 [Acaulospora morrowiae]|uniref:14362_t:CDS:1 n=1 Tax=Acaulospora morrowiae TaxID=94023 RepID=A0A9N8W2I1_9GLOM|nr:14362_t:CDS:2 [Acaulospora morrowiae]
MGQMIKMEASYDTLSIMSSVSVRNQRKPLSSGKQWLEKAIEERYVKCIEFSRFKNIQEIGTGAFGKVSRAEWVTGGVKLTVALKSINAFDYSQDNDEIYKEFIKELSNQINFHPYILKFFCVSRKAYFDPHCHDPKIPRNEKSDVFSLGVLLWELSSGRTPFFGKSRQEILSCIAKGGRETPTPGTPSSYVELYVNCWNGNPEKRPSVNRVMAKLAELEEIGWIEEDVPAQPEALTPCVPVVDTQSDSSILQSCDSLTQNSWHQEYTLDMEGIVKHIKNGDLAKLEDSMITFPRGRNIRIDLKKLDKQIDNEGNMLEGVVLACPPKSLINMLNHLSKTLTEDPPMSKKRLLSFICRNIGFMGKNREKEIEIFREVVAWVMKDFKFFDGQEYSPLHHLCDFSVPIYERFDVLISAGIDVNVLDERGLSPFLWVLYKRPLKKSLLRWLGEKGGKPVSEQVFCNHLTATMFTTWGKDDLKSVAAVFYKHKIKITNIKKEQMSLHVYIIKYGLLEQVEKMFEYFWDCYDSRVVNEALKYAEGKKKIYLLDLEKNLKRRRLEFEKNLEV